MPISSPNFVAAQGVLGASSPRPRRRELDQAFIDAVQDEFPTLVARQDIPAEAPPNLPHLALQSSTSQLAVSAVRADFLKRFYGDFVQSLDSCHDYIERKLLAVLRGWQAVDVEPSFIGVVLTVNFPFDDASPTPVEHILTTQLQPNVDPSRVQDAQAKVSVRLEDKYYTTFQVSNYETRSLERPLMPGVQQIEVKSWEGVLDETGIELVVDVNNRLQEQVERTESVVTAETIGNVLKLVRHAAATGGPDFVKSGAIQVESLSVEGI